MLSPDVVSRIAAGEVVERPASIVKELVENSIDAGADRIDIECSGGGAALVCVADNGQGIPAEQVDMAFLRHATSKIASLDDLVNVHSLGFRGEALPSIAAVADVEVSTSIGDAVPGTYLYMRGGTIQHHESRPRARGTTIAVRRLFRHFPARLKFLKAESTENGHSAQVVSQYALAYPSLAFSLLLEDRVALRSTGNGDLRDVVAGLFGAELARAMVPVEYASERLSVAGLAAPASLSRAGRSHQSTFINHRWVRSPLLQRAIDEAYRGMLHEGRNPIAILNLDLPPNRVDVNVHPSKAQVKFADEQEVFRAVREALKGALARTSVATDSRHISLSSGGTQGAWLVAEATQDSAYPPAAAEPTTGAGSLPPLRVLGQIRNTYVAAEGPDGLYLIDQHAAHERVVYDRLIGRRTGHEIEVQGLLEPIAIELTPAEDATLSTIMDRLTEVGFAIEAFGSRTYLLRSFPAVIGEADVVDIVHDLLRELTDVNQRGVYERLATSIACHAAVRAGKHLATEEMRHLIRQLEASTQPRTCPHGRPTVVRFDEAQLEKMFGRRT